MELIKPTIQVGNGAGILLPKSWENATVKVSLVEQPRIEEVIRLIDLLETKGIYLCGSYARNEQRKDSDIDVLIITNNLNKVEKKGKYEINYISKEIFKKMEAIIYYPMLLEAKPLLNEGLLLKMKKEISLSKDVLKKYIKDTKSILELNSKEIKLAELEEKENVLGSISYSLILRLRTYYILDCILSQKKWKENTFLKLIEKISGSKIAYKSYLNGKKKIVDNILPINEAKKILEYLKKETKKWEKELKKPSSKFKG